MALCRIPSYTTLQWSAVTCIIKWSKCVKKLFLSLSLSFVLWLVLYCKMTTIFYSFPNVVLYVMYFEWDRIKTNERWRCGALTAVIQLCSSELKGTQYIEFVSSLECCLERLHGEQKDCLHDPKSEMFSCCLCMEMFYLSVIVFIRVAMICSLIIMMIKRD